MSFDKTIQTYIFDGNPNGRMMCELSNWNGRVYKVARTELTKFANRPDAENTGIYFLFGKNERNTDMVYIGETEKILTRLKQHLNDATYWNDCVIIISKDNLLNKAHIKYLEHQFYKMAYNAGRAELINTTVPTCSSVSEYDEAMLIEFISDAKLLVNALGYKVFDSAHDASDRDRHTYFYIHAARGAEARGFVVADGFAVCQGSKAANSVTESMSKPLINIRNLLIEKNILNDQYVFTSDYIFTSPSYAAAIVMGRNANGRTEWKTTSHKTLKEIEEDL